MAAVIADPTTEVSSAAKKKYYDIDDAPIHVFSIEKEVLWLSLPAVRDNEDTTRNK